MGTKNGIKCPATSSLHCVQTPCLHPSPARRSKRSAKAGSITPSRTALSTLSSKGITFTHRNYGKPKLFLFFTQPLARAATWEEIHLGLTVTSVEEMQNANGGDASCFSTALRWKILSRGIRCSDPLASRIGPPRRSSYAERRLVVR